MHEFTRPIDPTQGLSIVSAVGRAREDNRYLWMAGNELDPDHILERDWIMQWNAGGGAEIQTNCFRRTLHGFVPRATLTPLEVWTQSFPSQFLSEGSEENAVRIESAISPESAGIAKPHSIVSNLAKPNQHVKFYPGDEIARILRNSGSRGVVEIAELQGEEWYDALGNPGVPQVLNADFFPTRPIQLSRIEEMIDNAASRSELHSKIAARKKVSCQVFRRFAQTELAKKHILLRSTNTQDYPHAYTGPERSYLEQLEMAPQDVANTDAMMQIMTKLAAQGGGSGAQVSPELIGQIASEVAKVFAQQVRRGPGRPPKNADEDPNEE